MGDLDYDCDVDARDFSVLASAWLSEEGRPRWNLACDMNIPADGRIDYNDVWEFSTFWLEDYGLGH